MFTVTIHGAFPAIGCSDTGGLDTLDWRRDHGLPDGHTHRVVVDVTLTDEDMFRRVAAIAPELASPECDWAMPRAWSNPAPAEWRVPGVKATRAGTTHLVGVPNLQYAGCPAIELPLPPRVLVGLLAEDVDRDAVAAVAEAYHAVYIECLAGAQATMREYEQQQAQEEQAAAARAAARELLADEFGQLTERIADLEASRDILSEALGAVPADALRGAVRKLAGQSADDTEAEILARAETAATVDLATERDEADDEDEMEDDEY